MRRQVVFFLGNGFSQGFGFPSFPKLLKLALTRDSGRRYREYIKRASQDPRLRQLIESPSSNVEANLTEVYRQRWALTSSGGQSWAESGFGDLGMVLRNAWNWLHRYTIRAMSEPVFDDAVRFFSDLQREYHIAIATTNYDLLPEAICQRLGQSYTALGDGNRATIPIRKLHGSIAWWASSRQVSTWVAPQCCIASPSFYDLGSEGSIYDLAELSLSVDTLESIQDQRGRQGENVIVPPNVWKEIPRTF